MIILTNYYTDYIKFLKENREKIREALIIPPNSERAEIYGRELEKSFLPLPEGLRPDVIVSATDGSEFIRELYNGMKIILTRAMTITGQEEFLSSDISIKVVNRYSLQTYVTRSMEMREHQSLIKCLSERNIGIAFLDGSALGRINENIERVVGDDLENFPDLYMDTMENLLKKAKEKNARLVFISKSSDSKVFKKELLDGSDLDDSARKREYSNSVTDHTIIKSLAKFPGYTVPITIEKNFRKENLRIVTTHILPALNDTPMRVDIIFMSGEGNMEVISEQIVKIAVWAYSGLKIHNVWLSDVDRRIKFTREESEEVLMKAFEKETGVIMPETRGERRARIRV